MSKTFHHSSDGLLLNWKTTCIEYILTSCFTVWYWNCTISDCKILQQILRTADKISVFLPTTNTSYCKHCICKASSIILAEGPIASAPPSSWSETASSVRQSDYSKHCLQIPTGTNQTFPNTHDHTNITNDAMLFLLTLSYTCCDAFFHSQQFTDCLHWFLQCKQFYLFSSVFIVECCTVVYSQLM